MVDAVDIGRLYHIFFNRLKITVARTGLTFMEDLRDRKIWMEGMLRANETAVFEEIDVETCYPLIISYMNELDWNEHEKEYWFAYITGVPLRSVEYAS
jgi:hypothetical protein